jgi:hypothetical protein
MRRFLIVYTMGYLGALGGAVLGSVVLHPTPTPGPDECGMWVLPGMFLGGAVGAALMTWVGLRLTRPAGVPEHAEQNEQGPAEP